MARNIAIVSLGQGNGKTTIALNLAMALRALKYKVLVLDADFTKDNMLEHLGMHDIDSDLGHMGHVLEGEKHINDVIYKHVTGLKFILSRTHDYDKLSYHYQDLLSNYDFILIDTPTQYQYLETVLKNADEALIVHGPSHSSKIVMDAINLLSRLKVLNLGLVLNRFSEESVNELFSIPVLEKIPVSKHIEKSYDLKNPLVHTHPSSKVAKKFYRIAKRLG
jgi:polysaccharide biosynthesis transport protein